MHFQLCTFRGGCATTCGCSKLDRQSVSLQKLAITAFSVQVQNSTAQSAEYLRHNQSTVATSSLGLLQIYEQSGLRGFREHLQGRGPAYGVTVKWLSYQLTPRAELFRRNSGGVQDMHGMQTLMRSNNYRTDPVLPSSASMILI